MVCSLRTFYKTLLFFVLLLIVVAGIVVATFPWWGPPIFRQRIGELLRDAGFSEAELSLQGVGFTELRVKVERLRFEGLTVSEGVLQLGYTFDGLRRGELAQATLMHPQVVVDLTHDWYLAAGSGQSGTLLRPAQVPDRFPIKNIGIDAAEITIQGRGWVRTFECNGRLTGQEALAGRVALETEGMQLKVQVDGRCSELSGTLTAVVKVDQTGDWLALGRDQDWLPWPEDIVLTPGSMELSVGAQFAGWALQEWHLKSLLPGVAISMPKGRISAEHFALELQGKGAEIARLDLKLSNGRLGYGQQDFSLKDGSLPGPGVKLESEHLSVSVIGCFPDSLQTAATVHAGRITWSEGKGVLTGLEGGIELTSMRPWSSKGMQTLKFASMKQGEFATGSGQLRISYVGAREEGPPLELEVTTTALGGKVRMQLFGRIREPLDLSARAFLESVDLEEVAALFPQFDGQIEGLASGELAFGYKDGQFVLLPGGMQLVAGTSGRFAYFRQGWLTQDPKLDPEAFVGSRPILEIMKAPQGASALTELALRDLKMAEFNLKIWEDETGEQSVLARIKGDRSIKGVIVPVVLDVPIRGDIKETINTVFELNARIRD